MLESAISVAVEALSWMEIEDIGEREALQKVSKQLKIVDANSLRLAQIFIFEVNRRLNFIDYLINDKISDNEFYKLTYGVKNFLRMYVYWVLLRRASLKEAISFLTAGRRVIGWKDLFQFEFFFGELFTINIKDILNNLNHIEKVSLRTCHPKWYVKYVLKTLGKNEGLRVLRKDLEKPLIYLRVNTLKDEEERIVDKLISEGVKLEKNKQLNSVFQVLKSKKPLTKLASYRNGLFHIQDKSSCLSVQAANPCPGQVILDLCAAPGSKTSFLAQIMENKGLIYSIDSSMNRMWTWKREMNRLGVEIAEPIISDISLDLPIRVKADIALIDPPCSGTGIFIKTPSLKWRIDLKDIEKFSEKQFRMIRNAANYLKEGGILVYSTCSITLEENEKLIERFLKVQPEFKLVNIEPDIGLDALRGLSKCRRLYPHKHESSGFFLAKMIKSTD